MQIDDCLNLFGILRELGIFKKCFSSGTFLEDSFWLQNMFHINPLDTEQVPAIFDILMMLQLKDSQVAVINTDDIYGMYAYFWSNFG